MERFKYDSVFFTNIVCMFLLLFVYAYCYVGFKSSLELVLYLFDSFRL